MPCSVAVSLLIYHASIGCIQSNLQNPGRTTVLRQGRSRLRMIGGADVKCGPSSAPKAHERECRRHEAHTGGPGVLPRKILKKRCNLVHSGAFGDVIHRISRYPFSQIIMLFYFFLFIRKKHQTIICIAGVLQSFPHGNIAKYKNKFTKCIKLTCQ